MHKIYLEKIDFSANEEKMEEILDMLICDTKERNYHLYQHVEAELYEMAYGKKISEEIAEKWVEEMLPLGRYWNINETTNAMYDLGFSDDRVDFFVVANMMKNDYEELTNNDDALALKLAHRWLNDEDAKPHKLYEYWKHIIKKDN